MLKFRKTKIERFMAVKNVNEPMLTFKIINSDISKIVLIKYVSMVCIFCIYK